MQIACNILMFLLRALWILPALIHFYGVVVVMGRSISFCFIPLHSVTYLYVSFRSVSFRLVQFRFDSFHSATCRYVSFRCYVSLRVRYACSLLSRAGVADPFNPPQRFPIEKKNTDCFSLKYYI